MEHGQVVSGAPGTNARYKRVAYSKGWEEVRCFNCRRLLCRLEPGALRAEHRVEVKCPKCDAMNYGIGAETT